MPARLTTVTEHVRRNRCWTARLWTPKLGPRIQWRRRLACCLATRRRKVPPATRWSWSFVRGLRGHLFRGTAACRLRLVRADTWSSASRDASRNGHPADEGAWHLRMMFAAHGAGSRSTTVSRFQIGPSREVQRKGRSLDTVIFHHGEL